MLIPAGLGRASKCRTAVLGIKLWAERKAGALLSLVGLQFSPLCTQAIDRAYPRDYRRLPAMSRRIVFRSMLTPKTLGFSST